MWQEQDELLVLSLITKQNGLLTNSNEYNIHSKMKELLEKYSSIKCIRIVEVNIHYPYTSDQKRITGTRLGLALRRLRIEVKFEGIMGYTG